MLERLTSGPINCRHLAQTSSLLICSLNFVHLALSLRKFISKIQNYYESCAVANDSVYPDVFQWQVRCVVVFLSFCFRCWYLMFLMSNLNTKKPPASQNYWRATGRQNKVQMYELQTDVFLATRLSVSVYRGEGHASPSGNLSKGCSERSARLLIFIHLQLVQRPLKHSFTLARAFPFSCFV